MGDRMLVSMPAGADDIVAHVAARAIPQEDVNARRLVEPSWVPPGRYVVLVTADGQHRAGRLDEGGTLVGRESHWNTCPEAGRREVKRG